jgi:hypothetical protein
VKKPEQQQPNIQVPRTYFNCETTTPRFGLNSRAAPAFDRTALMRRENQLTMINLGKIQSLSYDEQNKLLGAKLFAQSSDSQQPKFGSGSSPQNGPSSSFIGVSNNSDDLLESVCSR